MAVLAIKEFEAITCGRVFDVSARVVDEVQYRMLERFTEEYARRHKAKIFQHGPRRSLVAQNFVGVINMGRHQLEVLPKIDCSESSARTSLTQMIAEAWSLDLHAQGASPVREHDDSVLEVFVRLFCSRLWQAVRKGMVRRYIQRSDNLPVLRGRLSVRDQIRLNLARPDRLACDFDEFSDDNPLNQVLKAALRVLLGASRSSANQRSIAELLFCFQDVQDISAEKLNWAQAETDRLSKRYQPLLVLARLFIEGRSPDVISGRGEGFALLFDMNELFESYVGALARRVYSRRGFHVSLQGPSRHLAQDLDGRPAFKLKPDIVVARGAEVQFIIDTKWKRLKTLATREGVGSADVYQMHAYASQYSAAEVILLYPHHGGLGQRDDGRRATYKLREAGVTAPGDAREIGVATLDLRDLASVPGQLEALLRRHERAPASS